MGNQYTVGRSSEVSPVDVLEPRTQARTQSMQRRAADAQPDAQPDAKRCGRKA
jgi:hypothetical protein